MKKIFFVIFFVIFFLLFNFSVSANIACSGTNVSSCTGDNSIVLYVENDTGGYVNAHAQNVSVATYKNVICCNASDIGETVGVSCGVNSAKFVKLYSVDNSHVEVPSFSNYSINACISVTNRVVTCDYALGSCPVDNYCIASIASSELGDDNLSNAHISADCSSYNTKLCCGFSNSPPIIQSAHIEPSAPVYTNYTLQGICNATDADLDNVKYFFKWYKNDILNKSGSTAFSAQGVDYTVDNISSVLTQKGQNWTISCLAQDSLFNSSWLNSSTLTIINAPPNKVILSKPDNGDSNYYNKTPYYNWSIPVDIDGDSLTYDLEVSRTKNFSEIVTNETGLLTNSYSEILEQSFDTYYWRVRADDNTDKGEWSDTWNYTLTTYLAVTLTNTNIEFGLLNPNDKKNTTLNTPLPFNFTNEGNVYADLRNTSASQSLWTTKSLNTNYWQIKPRSIGSFNESGSKMYWSNVSESIADLIKYFDWHTSNDTVAVDVAIIVPSFESSGQKQSQINFTWGIA